MREYNSQTIQAFEKTELPPRKENSGRMSVGERCFNILPCKYDHTLTAKVFPSEEKT